MDTADIQEAAETIPIEPPVEPVVSDSAPIKKKRKKSRKKIKPKGCPRYFKNGYVRFCDELRPIVCEQNPSEDPVVVTKLVASKWSALSNEEKQPYLDEAKLDQDRYKRELKDFQREHPEEAEKEEPTTKSKKKKKTAVGEVKTDESKESSILSKASVDPSKDSPKKVDDAPKTMENNELPIFTDGFLEHNKFIEADLKVLRKKNIEIDLQNSVLMKHIENMENGVTKVEGEVTSIKQQNIQLEKYLTKMKIILASNFNSLPLPTIKSGASVENVEAYFETIAEMVSETAPLKSPTTVINKAREILRKIEL